MTRFSIDVEVNGEPAQVVKRNVDSPQLADSILFIDNIGVKVEGVDFTQDCIVTLRLKPTS